MTQQPDEIRCSAVTPGSPTLKELNRREDARGLEVSTECAKEGKNSPEDLIEGFHPHDAGHEKTRSQLGLAHSLPPPGSYSASSQSSSSLGKCLCCCSHIELIC